MGKKLKNGTKKKRAANAMRDKYWKELLQLVEREQWDSLSEYVKKHPWLATVSMSRTILPDYLAGEKDYGLLRLLCNIERVPPAIIDNVIELGASDAQGRGYLERLLAGYTIGSENAEQARLADSPIVAAKVLLTCENPAAVIEKIQDILEQGLQDQDDDRRKLAENCISRSQLFYDLLMLLYEHEAQNRLGECLECESLLQAASSKRIKNFDDIEQYLRDSVQSETTLSS